MNKMIPVEYHDIRVLTTEQLAEAYECDVKQIQMNYANNKDRFKEGKHFFKLEGNDLKAFKASATDPKFLGQFKHTTALMLWTRRGASRHCKMLGTDKAWEMFDELEETYFNPPQKKMTPAELIASMANELVQQDRRTARLEMKQERNEESFKILNTRMDTFNGVGTAQEKQQKLNTQVRAFACQAGLMYNEAWRIFKQTYNNNFHSNLGLLITNYKEKHGIPRRKKLTMPEYFKLTDTLDDALLVVDKLLNDTHAHNAIDSILKHRDDDED